MINCFDMIYTWSLEEWAVSLLFIRQFEGITINNKRWTLLNGTHWMASPRILKTAYTGAVRSTFEYGASAWASAAKTHTNKLDQVQNMDLRSILGTMKSTPIATMQTTAEVEPRDTRRNAKLLTLGEMPDHPLHKRLQDLTKNRLKTYVSTMSWRSSKENNLTS